MAAVNYMHMMSSSNMPMDFMPLHHASHSRSASTSSSAASSRPQSSQGGQMHSFPPSADDIYRATYHLGLDQQLSSSPSQYKSHMRRSHMARVAASPYSRDTDSVHSSHSSSSEAEDMSLYMGHSNPDYAMYGAAPPHVLASSPQEGTSHHPSGAFGRMSLGPDQGLEKLAASVRAATTTSASDRAKQIFVQAWLTANYAPYPEGNVPRQGLYFSYRRVCDQYGIPHINTATLGKAIRLCFPSIKTRRLGVRGNSKYHYCGIRPATTSEAEWLQDYIHKTNNTAGQPAVNAGMRAVETGDGDGSAGDDEDDEGSDEPGFGVQTRSAGDSKRRSLSLHGDTAVKAAGIVHDMSDKTPTASHLFSQAQVQRTASGTFPAHTSIRRNPQAESGLHNSSSSAMNPSYLPPPQHVSVRQFASFPSVEEALAPGSPHTLAARELWRGFEDHLDGLLECVRQLRFDQFEILLRDFWGRLQGHHKELAHVPAIAGLMAKADAIVYDEILEILRAQMLTQIPAVSLSGLRQFGTKMEKILLVSLDGYGNTFVEPKVELGARFGHLVLRFLDIYQVAQALNTVLTSQKQLSEMRASWAKVDFESVRNQSALVCNCRHEDLVQLLEVEFVAVMESIAKSNEPVREVMSWADKCYDRLMGGNRGHATEERSSMSSRSILIRWGYVTSQVMRDLTIRSDPAFGAFQILKLFLDDWIAVNVLRSVALSTNSVAASVEPVMNHVFQLSPMPGQEHFGSSNSMMAQTPTTSSMLAALQQNDYSSSLDSGASGFLSSDAYGSMSSYMDSGNHQSSAEEPHHPPGLNFGDFSGQSGGFDVGAFTSHDHPLNMSTVGTPNSEPESHLDVPQSNHPTTV